MSIFSSYFGKSISIKSRSVGSFVFDLTTDEAHESKLTITENPVESGAAIADHIILEPKEVTIRGLMVAYEPLDVVSSVFGDRVSMIKALPLPATVQAVTSQAINAVNRFASMAISTINKFARPIAPWIPDGLSFLVDGSNSTDRISKAYNDLLTLQKSGEVISASTGIHAYQDMLISSVGVYQTQDSSAEFIISLREVFIVETVTAGGMDVKSPASTKKGDGETKGKAGRAEVQSAKPANKGRTNPQSSKESVLHKVGGLF